MEGEKPTTTGPASTSGTTDLCHYFMVGAAATVRTAAEQNTGKVTNRAKARYAAVGASTASASMH